ncbi:hypothetical protein ENSA5_55340 [Enhygromyxa salina]|uniref:Uncharacterized protein n=2 Tax=Enhygromyxa salina TaxID=215803 RepID=A0A2S9XF01_9BACT|nr:hypothetical protein ENSA5_55340 [Enhygromyxa salina]
MRFPLEHERAIRDSLRAWVLFGGYGGRTRRGLGSLTVVGDGTPWLPKFPSPTAINELFGRDVFAQPDAPAGVTPLLGGARLFSSFQVMRAYGAWSKAVGWLLEFRQGSESHCGARRPGADKRPSISNWPEADKVRHFSDAALPWAHPPRHNKAPAWPRAGFGLPIIGQFQAKSRNKKPWEAEQPPRTEPEDFRIGWQQGDTPRDRLASPLILKPLALLANGDEEQFSPIALWLNRAPPDGKVILQRSNGAVVAGTEVSFTQFLAPDDKVFFGALEGKASLQDAFFAWLDQHGREQQSSKPRKNRPKRRRQR